VKLSLRREFALLRIIVPIVLLILCSAALAPCAPLEFYRIDYRITDANTTISINGIPVARTGSEPEISGSLRLNQWMKADENRIDVSVASFTNKDYARPSVMLTVVIEPSGDIKEDQTVASFSWDGTTSARKAPFQEQFLFYPKPGFPSLGLWSLTSPIALTSSVDNELRNFVFSFAKVLSTLNPSRLAPWFSFRINDINRSLHAPYQTITQIESDLTQLYPQLKLHSPSVNVVSRDMLQLHPLAGGRIVWVTGPNFSDPVSVVVSGKQSLTFPIYIGRMNNNWVLIR